MMRKSYKKSIILLSGLLAIAVIGFMKYKAQWTDTNSVESKESKSQAVPVKELKKTAHSHHHSHGHGHHHHIKRAPISKTTVLGESSGLIIDPRNKFTTLAKKSLGERFSRSIGKQASWKLSHLESTTKGHKVLVELVNHKTQETASYNALVEPKNGRILATWHRQIHH